MLASLLLEPGRLELRNIDIPNAGPGEVVVRVRTALTCGTELKTFRRGHPKIPTPTPLGHEFSGDIFEIGKGVANFKVGDQVIFGRYAASDTLELDGDELVVMKESDIYGVVEP